MGRSDITKEVQFRANNQSMKGNCSRQSGNITERVIMGNLRKEYSESEIIKLYTIFSDLCSFGKREENCYVVNVVPGQ